MKYFLATLILSLSFTSAHADNRLKEKAAASKSVVKEFAEQLKGKLKGAMKSGGPIKAINVCKHDAPLIAQQLSDKYGWKVGRTSLKTRNPANAPDAWEKKVLQSFEDRKQAGEDVKTMAHFAEVETQGVKSFRFMKAIPTGQICLVCHGENINPAVKDALNTNYPQDKARGYKVGDIRGAFTITQTLN